MADQAIYKITYPYCRGHLLAIVTNAITATESFEAFHARKLEQFISVKQISQLSIEKYERVNLWGSPCYLRAIY